MNTAPLEDRLLALEARTQELEGTIASLRERTRGEPGRDGKDGRDGRDAKGINYAKVLTAMKNYLAGNPASNNILFDPHISVAPATMSIMPAPIVNVAGNHINLPAPEVRVQVAPAQVTFSVPKESIKLQVVAKVAAAPEPWPTETTIVDREPDGRARVMETRPLPK